MKANLQSARGLKQKPLRQAGQSLEDRAWDYAYDHILTYMMVVVFATFLIFWEWWFWWFRLPRRPVLLTVFCCAIILFSLWKIFRNRKGLLALRMGVQGEKLVGQCLDDLRANGFHVIHDIPSEPGKKGDFNIDHVLIGPRGIYTVETKARSKPQQGHYVHYDGKSVCLDGGRPDEKPVRQAAAQARALMDILRNSTGKSYPIQPILTYPEWYIKETVKNPDIWVLNPIRIRAWVTCQPETLKPEEVKLAKFHLEQYIRSVAPT